MKILIGIFIVIVGGLLWWASPQRVIGVSPDNLTIPRDGSVTYTVQLMYKPWFKRTLEPIHGTIKSIVPASLVSVTPTSIDTQPTGNRSGVFTATGLAAGTGKITLNGTSRKGTHDAAQISFVVQ